MKGMNFVQKGLLQERWKWLQRDSQDRSFYGTNGLRDSIFDKRFWVKIEGSSSDYIPIPTPHRPHHTSTPSVENCARWCLLSSSCDMFYYTDDGGKCEMFPNDRKKFFNLYEIIEPAEESIANGVGGDIYVLHCSPAMENWVTNSDPYGHSLQRKLFN